MCEITAFHDVKTTTESKDQVRHLAGIRLFLSLVEPVLGFLDLSITIVPQFLRRDVVMHQ